MKIFLYLLYFDDFKNFHKKDIEESKKISKDSHAGVFLGKLLSFLKKVED